MKFLNNTRDFILDRLWSHHICGCIFFLLTLLTTGIALGYLIPLWIFAPIQTTCTITGNSIVSKYIGTEYVTFKKYRAVLGVNYTGPGYKNLQGYNYGPYGEQFSDLKERGFTLSLYYANQWANNYGSKQSVRCYYSLYDSSIVTFEYGNDYNWLILSPFPPLIIAILFCLYPGCYSYWYRKKKERDLMTEFLKFDALRTEKQEMMRRLGLEGGKDTNDEIDWSSYDPDEEPYEIQKIENIGQFFEEEEIVLKEQVLIDLDEPVLKME